MIRILIAFTLALVRADDEVVQHKIRYGKGPVGDLAFKDPVLEGSLIENNYWYQCAGEMIGNEPKEKIVIGHPDCLVLSIITKKNKPEKKMPVVVYFEGDYYKYGMSFGNEILAKNGVVAVTVKSRNGPLGYLSFENEVLPGNLGLKDQALALKWISDNIENYGGDSEKIVLMGSGSGAASVHYHSVSPQSRDLVKGAILLSGVGNDVWALAKPGTAKEKAIKLLKIFNCPTDLDENSLKCLQKEDTQNITEAAYEFLIWDFEPITVFQPIVEVKHKNAFLDQNPLEMVSEKPWVVHLAPNEGSDKIRIMQSRKQTIEIDFFRSNKYLCMKTMLYQEPNSAVNETISKLLEKYIPESWNESKAVEGIRKMFAMINYVLPAKKAVNKHKGPIYSFSFDPKDSMNTKKYNDGLSGHLDLPQNFIESDRYKEKYEDDKDLVEMQRKIAKMIVKFAESLKPEYEGANWEEGKGKFLHITTNGAKMVTINKSPEEEFWRSLPLFKNN